MHTGLDNRSHYVQLLDTLYRVQKFKVGFDVWDAHVRIFLSERVVGSIDINKCCLKFHDPNTGRWKYRSLASKVVLDLQGQLVAGGPFLVTFLKYMHDKTPATQTSVRDMINYCISSVGDGRFVTGMTAEAEYMEVIFNKATNWLCSNTAAGWPRSWALMELADRVEHTDKPLHKKLQDNWQIVLPKTAAAIEACKSSDRVDDAESLASRLTEQIGTGVGKMIDEHKKCYKWLYTAKYSPLWLFCSGVSGGASRAILSTLQGRGYFTNAVFQQPDLGSAVDKRFVDLFGSEEAAEELEGMCKLWSLLDDSLIPCFVQLSENTALTKEADSLVAGLMAGTHLLPLFETVKYGLATLSTATKFVEETFSEMKQVDAANQTIEKTNQIMSYRVNIVSLQRQERRDSLGGKGSAKQKGKEVVMLSEQMLKHTETTYSADRMKNISSRRTFKGHLKKKTEEEADRAVTVIHEARDNQKNRKAVTDPEWEKRQREFSSTRTTHEESLKAVDDLCDHDRVLAVLDEQKFVGQVGRSQVFYSGLGVPELERAMEVHFPAVAATFKPMIERKHQHAPVSDRHSYAFDDEGKLHVLPNQRTYEVNQGKVVKKRSSEWDEFPPMPLVATGAAVVNKRQRKAKAGKESQRKVKVAILISGRPIPPPRRMAAPSGTMNKGEKLRVFSNLRGWFSSLMSVLEDRERSIVQDFGFFVRASRGHVADRGLTLNDTEGGPAVKEAYNHVGA